MSARRAADWLTLAAAPGFALMALLTAIDGSPGVMLCGGNGVGSMAAMYLLMSLVHAAPWLRLVAQASRSPSPIAARACSDSEDTTG